MPELPAVHADAQPAVRVDGLTVCTDPGTTTIVSDISFEIAPGRTMGLVGESGSGKSTVGVALLGLARRGLRIAGGRVLIGNTDVLALNRAALTSARGRLVSYVPQDPAAGLNPAHRIGAQLREALSVHRDVLENLDVEHRVAEVLDEVNLPATRALLRSYPHQLSGGQQQRVGIAIAFACRPRLIVLDEPTTGLDVTTQRHVLETIRELTTMHGVSAVYVSHDLAAVAQIADETAVMYAGRIVERGPTQPMFMMPAHPYTAGLLAAAPTPDDPRRLVGIEGHPPRPGSWPKGCAYAGRCPRVAARCRETLPELSALSTDRAVRCINPQVERGGRIQGLAIPEPPAHEGATLQVRGLRAHYGPKTVLHDVGFDVPAGKCTAIVGESGSGKTTLARCLVGLHGGWSGEIRLEGAALAPEAPKRTKEQLRRLQYIFQNPYGSLNPTMTIVENVEEPLRHFERLSAGDRRQRALAALEQVNLAPAFAEALPGRISGGERQRAAVARALVVNPEILVCDEITSALDVSVQALLVEELRDLQIQRGLSMVFITHNLAVVRSIAQHVIVLEQGHVVESGPVDAVLRDPQHHYTRQLLADLPRLEATPAPVA